MVVLMFFVIMMMFVVAILMCMNMVFVGMFMVMLMHVLVFFNAQCDYPRMCAGDAAFYAALEVISHIRNSQ